MTFLDWRDVYADARFDWHATPRETLELYDELEEQLGHDKARLWWRMACGQADHISLQHAGKACDC